jgi:hypothetical protein
MKKFVGVEADKGTVYLNMEDVRAILLPTDRVNIIGILLASGHSIRISRKEHFQELKEIFMLDE